MEATQLRLVRGRRGIQSALSNGAMAMGLGTKKALFLELPLGRIGC